jgi:hypothetical protein
MLPRVAIDGSKEHPVACAPKVGRQTVAYTEAYVG